VDLAELEIRAGEMSGCFGDAGGYGDGFREEGSVRGGVSLEYLRREGKEDEGEGEGDEDEGGRKRRRNN